MKRQCSECRNLLLDKENMMVCRFGLDISKHSRCGYHKKGRNKIAESMRICTRCLGTYSVGEFYRNRRYSDGYDIYCKYCRKELNILYRTGKENNPPRFCKRCGNERLLSEFYRNRLYAGGIDPYCIYCRSDINAEQRAKRKCRKASTET